MKRLTQIGPACVACCILMAFFATGCVKSPIAKYETKNPDEKGIVETILAYQDAINSYDWNTIPEVFTANGTIKLKPVKSWVAANKKLRDKLKEHNCQIRIMAPDAMDISGDKAHVEVVRMLDCSADTLTILFDLEKVGGEWKIAEAGSR